MSSELPSNDSPEFPPLGRIAPPLDLLPPPSRWKPSNVRSSWIVLLLGAWLFASAFMWPHSRGALANAVLIGASLFACGAVGAYVRWVRWLTALVTVATRHDVSLTLWNNLVVGLGVLAVSVFRR